MDGRAGKTIGEEGVRNNLIWRAGGFMVNLVGGGGSWLIISGGHNNAIGKGEGSGNMVILNRFNKLG